MTMVVTDEQLDKEIEAMISQIVKGYVGGDPVGAAMEIYAPKLQGLTAYISYRALKETATLTKNLIKWNRVLSVSTTVLAIATVSLAVLTYLK